MLRPYPIARIAAIVLLAVCAFRQPSSYAQDLRGIEPKPVPPQVDAPKTELPPGVSTVSYGDTTVMMAELKGIIVIVGEGQLAANPPVPAGGIDVARVPRMDNDAARNVLKPFLGQPVSMASLNRMAGEVNAFYSEQGFPFVSIGFPQQNITSGVVQILVVEGVLGQVSVEGNRYFSKNYYLSQVRSRPGDPLDQALLNEDVNWINGSNPFRAGDFFLKPGGSGEGTTDLTFRVRERLPLRLTLGYNNHGTDTSGEDRVEAGINWGNAFGLGHQLNYQFTTNKEFSDYTGHSVSYLAPLPWRHTFSVLASKSNTRSRLDDPLLSQGSKSFELSLAYKIPLRPLGDYRHSLSLLFDFKESNSNLDFSDMPVTDNDTQIFQWGMRYDGTLPDAWGTTSFSIRGIYSPGSMNSRNDDAAFDISRAGADADYVYAAFNLDRTQYLPAGFALVVRNQAQVADGNLLGSEQMQFGGYSSIRGYDEGDTYGDQGFILTQELHPPALQPGRWFGMERIRDQLDVFIFHDYGFAQDVDPLPGQDSHTCLQSAGVGLIYTLGRHVSLNCSYGWQIRHTGEATIHHVAMCLSH